MEDPRKLLTERISDNNDKFTTADASIADYLQQNYPMALLQNASELAVTLGLNIATITRFFTKLGYTSAKEAMADFREEVAQFINSSPADRFNEVPPWENDEENMLGGILEQELANVSATISSINPESLRHVAEIIGNRGKKVFIVGAMKERSIAYYLYMQLLSFKEEVYLYGNAHLTNFLLHIDKDSICIFYDFRRHASVNKQICEYAKKCGATIIAISDTRFSATSLRSDHMFLIPCRGATIFDSYTGAIAFTNALMAFVVKAHGETFKSRYHRLEEIYQEFNVFSSFKAH